MKDPADPAYRCAPARFVRAIARGGAAVEHDGHARGDRRDRLRAAADPGLRAGRARRLVQAAGAGRHAAGAGHGRRQGPRHPDPPELDPGAPGRTPHLRRLPQPAPRRRAQLRRGRQHAARGADARRWRARTSPARPWPRCAPGWTPTALQPASPTWCSPTSGPTPASPASRRARRSSLRYTGNADAGRRPGHAGAASTASSTTREHIQPLWTRATAAPTPAPTATPTRAKLDLRGTVAGTGRLVSYEELLLGDPVIDPATGLPQTRLEEGVPMVVRGAAAGRDHGRQRRRPGAQRAG